jgi:hypothetical protein
MAAVVFKSKICLLPIKYLTLQKSINDMTTIVLKVKDKKQLIALMDVVQRFKISFSGNMDETEYLLSTDENRESIEKSLKQSDEGKTRAIKTSDLWK